MYDEIDEQTITAINVYLPNSGELGNETTDEQAETFRTALRAEFERRYPGADITIWDTSGVDTITDADKQHYLPEGHTIIGEVMEHVWDIATEATPDVGYAIPVTVYKILVIRNYYGPYETVTEHYDPETRHQDAYTYDSIEAAQAAIDGLDGASYYLSHNESGRPDYVIVESDYQIGLDDLSDYNWDEASCDCGGCETCHDMLRCQDVEFARAADVRGATDA